MIDRTKLPDFLQNMPEERLKEIMKVDNFDKAMDRVLHAIKKKGKKQGKN